MVAGIIPAIASIVWGILSFLAGRGLWTGKFWGKSLAVTMSLLYIIFGVISFMQVGSINYISVIINLAIILYLLLSKNVFTSFKSDNTKTFAVILSVLAILVYVGMQYPVIISSGQKSTVNSVMNQNENTTNNTVNTASNNSPQSTKTYTNPTYSFQITIPQDSVVQQNVASSIDTHVVFLEGNKSFIVMSIVNESPILDTLDDLVNSYTHPDTNSVQKTNTTIAGQPAIHTIITGSDGQVSDDYFILHNNYYLFDISKYPSISSDQFDYTVQSMLFTQ